MKSNFRHIGLAKICGWFGISRQAYYQYNWETSSSTLEEEMVLLQVRDIRSRHRRMGTRKLYEMLHPFMLENHIKIGRDALFDLLSANHLLVRKRKRRIQTTNSYHRLRKYPNLVRELVPTAVNQLWVSDITYWKLGEVHVYISFITDVYSHKIVGYHVGETMETVESLHALQMAFSGLPVDFTRELIHHSDRGIQYCSQAYVNLLEKHRVRISMTENGDPLENAVAERINGIIKEEYLYNYDVDTVIEARDLLREAVHLYNEERPHMSIGNFTPNQIHKNLTGEIPERLWKNYFQPKMEMEKK